MSENRLDESIKETELQVARQALANPEDDEDYRAYQVARQALATAQTDVRIKEALWFNKIKPAVDERARASGHCQASRDGDYCSHPDCPQAKNRQRSCPLPGFRDELEL